MPQRTLAVEALAQYDITGPQVYLIDVLPLLEMLWADGQAQAIERDLVEKFMAEHVAHLNALAGFTVLTEADGAAFLRRFLDVRPAPALMASLRVLVPPVRLSSLDVARDDRQREALLRWCLDIGAACVTDYPYGDHDRFSADEKRCFEELVVALTR